MAEIDQEFSSKVNDSLIAGAEALFNPAMQLVHELAPNGPSTPGFFTTMTAIQAFLSLWERMASRRLRLDGSYFVF